MPPAYQVPDPAHGPFVTGRIDAQEIMQSLRDLGVKISEQQAEKILKR